MEDHLVRLVPNGDEEVPIADLPPRQRLGALVQRIRQKSGYTLAEAVAAINEKMPNDSNGCMYTNIVSELSLNEVEKGIYPVTSEQIRAIIAAFDVMHLREALVEAAQEWNRDFWTSPKNAVEQVAVESKHIHRCQDTVELLEIISIGMTTAQSACSCMNMYADRIINLESTKESEKEDIRKMVESVSSLVEAWCKMADNAKRGNAK